MMTASKQNEADLQQHIEILKQQLAQAQKLSALGELLGTTTHEFNNVLMTIINYAKMGMRRKDERERNKAFEKILAAGQRAAKITNSILATARNRSNSHEPTDLVKLMEDSLMLLERELTKYRISVERDFQPIPEAMISGNQIQQVLLNLLINARQAMPKGGQVLLRLRYDAETNQISMTVRDTGCGISPQRLPHIFDPYFTTKNGPDETGKGGTGLGLSSCREIIQSHHGRIRVQSTPGKGTAFTIILPAVEAAPTQPASPVVAMGATTAAQPQQATS